MKPGCAAPSPHRAVSGARSFSMNRTPAPQPAPDANGAYCLHVQRHATAANDRSRLVFRTSDRCAYARDRNRILPRNQIYHVSGSLQSRNPPGKAFFHSKTLFFQTCTSLLYKFHPAGDGKETGIRPGLAPHLDFTSARSRKNEAESRRLSAFFSLIRKSPGRRGCIPAPGVVY